MVVPRIQDQSNLAGPITRSPQKIILMSGNRRWQSKLRTKEIDRSSLAIVLAKDYSALLIFGTQVIVNVPDGRNHFLPAKLIGENLWERSRVRCFSARQLQPDSSHVRDEFAGRQNRHHQWGQ